MELSPYVASIEDSLLAAAAAGDDATRRTAEALSAALEPAVRLAIMNALADTAVEISDALGNRVVEVRLNGGDVRVVVSPLPDDDGEAVEEAAQLSDASGVLSRVTLRLPDALKIEAERAAATQGVSLNTWLSRAVRETLRGEATGPTKRPGQHEGTHRVRGWVQG
jgi:hypothetical protein